ncbi:MAG: MogA/MoaB family molybdenum cofactor biosynthesis protein [Methanosarcinaceae archaeon]|nr:MogA/MoaB family molybdenum cofactor biosynthesis protein [Methanosarcinaceae archaeon]
MNVSTTDQHKKDVRGPCNFVLITVSTSRFRKYGSVATPEAAEDVSGQVMHDIVARNGHNVLQYMLISDDPESIKNAVISAIDMGADIIVSSGGTGLTSQDVTIESIAPMFDKEMPGFGELFRYKSIDEVGTAVILTRAEAGIIKNRAIFCLPGSPNAVRLALESIIVPEAGHIVKHIQE